MDLLLYSYAYSSGAALLTQAGDEPARQKIRDERDDENDESGLQQRREEEAWRGLAELVGDDAGERIAGIEQARARSCRLVADHHRDCHGLTQRTSQRQDDPAQDAYTRKRHYSVANHFPPCSSQC